MWKIYWDDIKEGDQLQCKDIVFNKEEIIEFGKKYDPQPFHVDEISAEKSIFKGIIASGLHVMSACTKVIAETQKEYAIHCGLGLHEAKIYNPVRPRDTIKVEAKWSELLKTSNNPDRGIAKLKCKAFNQNGDLIIEYGYTYLMARRNT